MWKQIRDFDYEINEDSDIRRISNKQLKKSFKRKDGYIQVQLFKNKEAFMFQVHIIKAECFIPNPNNLKEINHKDSIRDNNDLNNLEWCTHSENCIHSYVSGNASNKGSNNGFSKLIESDIVEIIKLRNKGVTREKVAKQYNVSKSTISGITNGHIWKHTTKS